MHKPMQRVLVLSAATFFSSSAIAQVVMNEANAVGATQPFVEIDPGKPYEGFDYGIIPYSGNTNSPTAPVDPGNPFNDVDGGLPGIQMELNNGWTGTTGWGRIAENGGDWIEFVVTQDFSDLRGYWLYWENDDDQDGNMAEEGEYGFVRLSFDPAWSNLRAGTIITISELNSLDEIRDRYPVFIDPATMPVVHDTGHNYDLNTDIRYDPIGIGTPAAPQIDGDWHIHFWLNETITQNGNMDTQYFLAGSNIKVDNDDWRHFIFDSTNPGPSPSGDLTTGLIQGPIGETEFDWGQFTGGGGVGNQEVISLNADPADGLGGGWYEDIDFSTFGRPNLYNDASELTPDSVQDFSTLRAWLPLIVPGDANYDNAVDFADAQKQLESLTGPNGNFQVGWACGSFDADGDVDLHDLRQMQLSFGN